MLLINSQLEELWYCLQRHVTTPAAAAEDERINYDDFSQVNMLRKLHTAAVSLLQLLRTSAVITLTALSQAAGTLYSASPQTGTRPWSRVSACKLDVVSAAEQPRDATLRHDDLRWLQAGGQCLHQLGPRERRTCRRHTTGGGCPQRSVQLAVLSCRPRRSPRGSVAPTDTHPCPSAGAESLLNCSQARAECLERFGPQAEEYTQASRFLRFRKDEEGAISVLSFFNYVMRRNAMLQTVSAIWP